NWYQITILQGLSLDEEWLRQEIQTIALIQYQATQYHFDGNNSSFYVEDQSTASSIRNCSKKISAPDGNKITILMRPCSNPMPDEKILKIQEVLASKYNGETHHLNAASLFNDEGLQGNKIFLKVSTSAHMYIVTKIIAKNISALRSLDMSDNRLVSFDGLKHLVQYTPMLQELNLGNNKLRSLNEMEKISAWDLTKLTLDGNPLCSSYKSQTEYISDVREWFPNLTTLDGHTLPPPVKFDVEKVDLPTPVLDFVQTTNGAEAIKLFVQQYFKCYDESRSMLAEAYHENCLFTLSIPPHTRGAPFSKYFKHTRNLKQIKTMSVKTSTISRSRSEILTKLELLPKSSHDITSFHVDIIMVTSEVTNFIVRGVYKEGKNGPNGFLRAFSRSFVCQVTPNGLSIINEQFFLRNPTTTEMRNSKPPPAAKITTTPTSAPAAPSRDEMVASFSRDSAMNAMFSRQCLEENDWNYEKAGTVFMELKAKGAIPPEAFVK
uniref:NTF2 domain-containing protein n=1 Tax=Ciona savignyi TaxID=51511 RepID=H2Z6T4_CIOSA